MYKQKQYIERSLAEVFYDIEQAQLDWPEAHRVFLADGDALALPTQHLVAILEKLNEAFPRLTRVSCYATPSNILHKSVDELEKLKQHKLNLVYLGIESGSDVILKKITKGASQRGIGESMHKAYSAGIKVSGTVVLGLGGKSYCNQHIDGTIELLNDAPITYLSTLQLFIHETALDDFYKKFNEPFEFQTDEGILLEQFRFIEGLNPPKPIVFRSNHASNALALAGNLPKDRDKLLLMVQQALSGERDLRPHFLRGL